MSEFWFFVVVGVAMSGICLSLGILIGRALVLDKQARRDRARLIDRLNRASYLYCISCKRDIEHRGRTTTCPHCRYLIGDNP